MADTDDLVISAGFSDAKLVTEANRVIAFYKKKGEEAQKAFTDAQGKVTNTQAVKAHMREMDKLANTYDPAYRAAKTYEKAVKDLDRALAIGSISQKQHSDAVVRAARQFNQAAEATDAGIMRAGGGLQNLGFQAGDFAVQVGAGTSAVQALGQQLPQLLGGFGTLGALMGAAAAIAIPVGAALVSVAFDSKTLEDRLKDLADTTEDYTSKAEAAAAPIDVLRQRYGDLADEVQRANSTLAMMAGIRARNDALGAARSLASGMGFSGLSTQRSAGLSDAEWAAVQANIMDDLRKKTGATEAQMDRLRMAFARMGSSNDLDAVVRDGDNLLTIFADLAQTASSDQLANLDGWAAQIQAVMQAAQDQIKATRSEAERVTEQYQTDTEKLKSLSRDRTVAQEMVDEAVRTGSEEAIRLAEERIRLIDREIDKTRALARETDVAFQGMLRAYTEYGDSRRAGNEWANSAAGFEAEYVARRASGAGSAEEELVRAVTALAEQMDISARDLLAVMSFETKGELRPDTMGPVTEKWGQHFGLIQWGERGAAKRYGVSPDDSITQQVIAAGKYLQDAGVKAGDNLASIYAAVLSGDARKVYASDLAAGGVVGNVTEATSGDQFAGHIARADGLLAAYGGIAQQAREDAAEADRALNDQIRERELLAKQAKEYGEQLARNLLTDQETARLNAQQADQIAAIKAQGLGDEAESRAIAEVTAEIEKQRTILTLLADAKRRNVDLDAMLADGSMTYRDAINALGEAKRADIVTTNERAIAEGRVAEAQQFMADAQERTKQGLLDSIIAGESFSQVLGNLAQMFARAAAEAALFNTGPMAGGGGGGLLGGIWSAIWKGYSSGGYTGNIGTSRVAGVVHGGEYVISAPAVKRIGLPNLEAMHKGQSVGEGGSGGAVDVRVFMDENGNWQAAVERISGKVSARQIAGSNRVQQDRQYLRNGR